MNLFADQDVYQVTIQFLQSLGHDVVTARDLDMQRARDSEILDKAKELSRILITRDKDFGTLVFLNQSLSWGVIFLRIKPTTINLIHQTLATLLDNYSVDDLSTCFCVIEENRYRLRHLAND